MSEQKISKEIAELQRKHYDEWPEDDRTCVTPLLELLQAVPLDARMTYEHPDGNGYTMIPVGPHCRAAADRITELELEVERLREVVERHKFALAQEEWRHEPELVQENVSLRNRLNRLVKRYAEAIDDIADWAAYASDYFQDKHDLAGCLERHRKAMRKSIAEAQKET